MIVNKRITTAVTLDIRRSHGISNLNIAQVHVNIFFSLKKKKTSLKIITATQTINTDIQFP